MQIVSWGLTAFVIYAPIVVGLIFLIAAGILFARIRSPATALFFFGLLVATFAPWAFQFIGGTEHSSGRWSIEMLVIIVAFTIQILGFLFYVLSVPKKSSEN